MSNFEPLSINADRICEAISKIGYKPSAAILDIVDNSVVAGSKNIIIRLFMKEGMNINNRQNVVRVQVIDDGKGMSIEEIKKALQLGSDVSYSENSLSKYGMGLKSAGFSLGNRIEVVSKTNQGKLSEVYFLDRNLIRDKGVFGFATMELTSEYDFVKNDFKKGTVVSVEDMIYTSRVSAKSILEEIAGTAGVYYSDYLNQKGVKFTIQIVNSEGKKVKEHIIESRDILYWDRAYPSFEKENYDCKRPCRAVDTFFENPLQPDGEKIRLQVSIFPKDSMKNYLLFTDEEREEINNYDVSLKNSGFYFYRNGRLIKWGEKLIINRKFGFRAKISFTTEHDELFDVDVSKQHLTVSEEVEATLRTLVAVAKDQSEEIFNACDHLLEEAKNKGDEGAEFNFKNSTLEEEEDESVGEDKKQTLERKKKLEEASGSLQGEEPKQNYENEEDQEGFRRVRYWSDGRSRNVWDSAMDHIEGTYVLINKFHPFYDLVLSKFEGGSPERQAFEAMFHALAVGHNQVIQKFHEADMEIVMGVLNKFERTTSTQLENWVHNNWDLFEGGN